MTQPPPWVPVHVLAEFEKNLEAEAAAIETELKTAFVYGLGQPNLTPQ